MVRNVSAEEGKPICILADLQGPKIRTGKLKNHKPVQLVAGKHLTITPREIEGTATLVGTVFKTLAENLEPGSRILLSDGLIELRVDRVKGVDVVCEIINGGMLGENKGINLPGIPVNVPSLTEKDEEDLVFAISQGVDTVAVSFVRTADDVRHVKTRLAALNSDAWVIAKLEKPQAIEHLDSILEVADAIMVARGDLGVEVPPEKVPAIQKHIIRRAAEYRKPVITATQMLESMIENPRPTRAEASDVANAIYDGTDAVMLSGETAAGKYPVEAVAMMAKIVTETEHQIRTDPHPARAHHQHRPPLRRRDHLRVYVPRRRRPRPRRHRHLHRDRLHRPPALQVPPRPTHLRVLPLRACHQPLHAALGRLPHPLQTLPRHRQAGRHGRRDARSNATSSTKARS